MTKYRHIPTGTEAIKYGSDEYCTTKGYVIPKFIVECGSDWQEIRDRKPIRQLPDENGKMVDMFDGDDSFYVDSSYNILTVKVDKYLIDPTKYHATQAAAEKYVRDNKPEYPAGLVDPLFSNTDREWWGVIKIIQELQKFKESKND